MAKKDNLTNEQIEERLQEISHQRSQLKEEGKNLQLILDGRKAQERLIAKLSPEDVALIQASGIPTHEKFGNLGG